MAPDYSRYREVLVEKKNGIATVTLNRPEILNAFAEVLHDAMEHIWLDIAEDPEINVVILTGAGKAFSAGGDIKKMMAGFRTDAARKAYLQTPAKAKRVIANMLDVTQPIIAAVNGDAMGLGASLALACDISVMNEAARIGDTHVRVGLVAGDGGPVLWPMLLGANRAKEYLMRGRVFKGAEACQIGIVNHAVPADQVMPRAMEIAEELNALPPLAVRWTKLAVNKQLKAQLELVQDVSAAFETLTFSSDDHLEAAKAFVEKRKPEFRGS
jgi:enoyl-CoA hydratase/carnithine racemase